MVKLSHMHFKSRDVFAAGYYVNNHRAIPAVWKNGKRINLSIPKHVRRGKDLKYLKEQLIALE